MHQLGVLQSISTAWTLYDRRCTPSWKPKAVAALRAGGAYSRGPFHLRNDVDQGTAAQSAAEGSGGAVHLGNGSKASPDGDEEPARPAIHAVEQCLTWGGEQRIRLHLTLAVAQDGQ